MPEQSLMKYDTKVRMPSDFDQFWNSVLTRVAEDILRRHQTGDLIAINRDYLMALRGQLLDLLSPTLRMGLDYFSPQPDERRMVSDIHHLLSTFLDLRMLVLRGGDWAPGTDYSG